ncbi:hypothetical protein HN371_14845 [Candidatus Poribacteria bacterium]|nr:hypothetical protein [Candidatus Poribacteria bacterium]MBT5532455.1 hypothetical protein [Candidatus Poribacteria bacterium]MBT5709748.1 hypothetical protein [Candidatus Poribacteria bacterium]MBT7101840.1 hypothetical protein [Candidatus Poribacteria bacterium]MBT7807012.1 hypothetical protein [Candidatus Poribacteria bacterium]
MRTIDASQDVESERMPGAGAPPVRRRGSIVLPRLLIGLVVLICTEVFSGASVKVGLWHPWTWIVTYWLYFAHFFLFTTLAVRTGRTSFSSLYLWGVLFGLYESWITKVIWHGYGGDGKFVMGSIGPYGFSEISMVFIFHPVAAFILPLAVACLLCPPLRRVFPDLAWLTSRARLARGVRVYLIASFGIVLAMNSGGPVHLAANLAIVLALLVLVSRLARPGLAASDGVDIVAFRAKGFVGLCVYLAALYGLTYVFLMPAGRPSVPVQLLTFVFYAIVIVGLRRHRRREPVPTVPRDTLRREMRSVLVGFASVLAVGMILSPLTGRPAIFAPVVANFVIWTPLGFLLTGVSLVRGARRASV